jgi:hypothetical protein
VNGSGNFSGTSNATPVIAGMYARALHWARQGLAGPSTAQRTGKLSQGVRSGPDFTTGLPVPRRGGDRIHPVMVSADEHTPPS